jgi:hypothetical protein
MLSGLNKGSNEEDLYKAFTPLPEEFTVHAEAAAASTNDDVEEIADADELEATSSNVMTESA